MAARIGRRLDTVPVLNGMVGHMEDKANWDKELQDLFSHPDIYLLKKSGNLSLSLFELI